MKKIILFVCGLLILPNIVFAKEPLHVTYSIYASGFEVVNINSEYSIDPNTYAVQMDLKTVGLLGSLAPWSGVLASNGMNKGVESIPQYHQFANTWRDETKTTEMTFNDKGVLTSFKKTDHDGSVKDTMPNADVSANTVDILTAVIRAAQQDSCDGTQTAMDGKRKFDMVFKSQGYDELDSDRYNKFEGQAEACTIEIKPVAGKWRDKKRGWMSIQEQAKNDGKLPKIWFGKVGEDGVNIPVRLEIHTGYGAMIMHLTGVK